MHSFRLYYSTTYNAIPKVSTARLRSGQVAGVGASPESHGRGVNGFVRVAVGGDVVAKEAVGRSKVVLGGG